jgi:outer membrane protein
MSLRLRPLSLAILLTGAAGAANAADLMQAYELARQSDPQLAAADANRLAQRELPVQSRSALLPQVNGSLGFQDQDGGGEASQVLSVDPLIVSSGSSSSENRNRNSGVTINQSIYDHRNYTRLKASRVRAEQAIANYDAAADFLILRVAEAYFNVLSAIDSLAFARAEERAVKRQLDQADQRFEVGLTAITDVHEARARYDNARANAISADVALDDAREALTEITGEYLANFKGLDETFAPSMPEPNDLARWVDLALAENPVLAARALAVQAARHDVSTARAGHLPYLNGSVSYGDNAGWGDTFSSGLTTPTNNSSYGTTIGLQLTIPIFSGFLTQSQVRQALHNRDAIEDQHEQERRAVTRQTRNAFRALMAGLSGIEARKQALVSAQSALEATQAGFEVGTRTIVDVLNSQQILFLAQRDYSTARHQFLVNTLRLKQAAGVVEAKDVAEVNRFLVSDAEAKLEAVGEDGTGAPNEVDDPDDTGTP